MSNAPSCASSIRDHGGRVWPLLPIAGAGDFADGRARDVRGMEVLGDTAIVFTLTERSRFSRNSSPCGGVGCAGVRPGRLRPAARWNGGVALRRVAARRLPALCQEFGLLGERR